MRHPLYPAFCVIQEKPASDDLLNWISSQNRFPKPRTLLNKLFIRLMNRKNVAVGELSKSSSGKDLQVPSPNIILIESYLQ